jgi:hypothetical protein
MFTQRGSVAISRPKVVLDVGDAIGAKVINVKWYSI